jgi:hypothetical protein
MIPRRQHWCALTKPDRSVHCQAAGSRAVFGRLGQLLARSGPIKARTISRFSGGTRMRAKASALAIASARPSEPTAAKTVPCIKSSTVQRTARLGKAARQSVRALRSSISAIPEISFFRGWSSRISIPITHRARNSGSPNRLLMRPRHRQANHQPQLSQRRNRRVRHGIHCATSDNSTDVSRRGAKRTLIFHNNGSAKLGSRAQRRHNLRST